MVRRDPLSDQREEPAVIPRKGLRARLVAHRPAVHVRQESFHGLRAFIEVPDHRDQKEMHKVLFIVPVREFRKKLLRLRGPADLLGDLPHIGRSDAQNGLLRDVGDQFALKVPVLFAAAGSKPFVNRHYPSALFRIPCMLADLPDRLYRKEAPQSIGGVGVRAVRDITQKG